MSVQSLEGSRWGSVPALGVIGFAVFAAFMTGAIFLTGTLAWDDGAITLAFARTLSAEGIFALTGASEVVEGTSSPLFALIMAFIFSIVALSFEGMIAAGQFTSLAFLVATLVALNLLLTQHIAEVRPRVSMVLLFAFLPMHLAEVLNGMEMTLLAFLFLVFSDLYLRRSHLVLLVVPLLLLTRFEAVLYLSGAILAHGFFDRKARRYALQIFAATLLGFAVITLARLSYFGTFLPNTIWAKLHAPYSHPGSLTEVLGLKWLGLKEFMTVNLAFILGLSVIALRTGLNPLCRDIRFWLVFGFGVFSFITGKNWGYDGRMFVAALPLFVWVLAAHWSGSAQTTSVQTMLTLVLGGTLAMNAMLFVRNYDTVWTGAVFQGYAAAPETDSSDDLGVTPENFRQTGKTVEALGNIIGLDRIGFMAPDVGGLGLCCDPQRLRVIDLALLTNPTLAQQGYAGFPAQLALEAPDIIETHGVWSYESGIYETAAFQSGYQPIVFRNTMLWLRRDHVDVLRSHPAVKIDTGKSAVALEGVRYHNPEDIFFFVDQKAIEEIGPEFVVFVSEL